MYTNLPIFSKKVLMWLAVSELFNQPVKEKGLFWVTAEGNSHDETQDLLRLEFIFLTEDKKWQLTEKGKKEVFKIAIKILTNWFPV